MSAASPNGELERVRVLRFGLPPLEGWASAAALSRFALAGGLELGRVQRGEAASTFAPLHDIRAICLVRRFGPPRGQRSAFRHRPKRPGLLIRARLRDGAELEGAIAHDLAPAQGRGCLELVPPDSDLAVRRVLVPLCALESAVVIGVIGSLANGPVSARSEKMIR